MKYALIFLYVLATAAIAQQTINDLTVKDFKVISTQKASTPCPAMTQTQRDAAPSGSAKCVFNTTTGKLNVHNGSLWKAAGGGVDAWATATVYAVDDLVIQSTKIYRCLIAHTSGTFSTDLAASKWEEISAYPTDYVSTSGNQTIGGTKTFSSTIVGSINGNAATVTTNANLTGAITSTGNATLLGSFSSSNLLTALSDETGSGSAVFSTSPTLVTPTLGAATGTSLGLGGSLASNTILSVSSTSAASIPAPKMTTAQKNAITPTSGMAVFDTDLGMLQYYNGSQWVANTNIQLDNVYSAKVSSAGVVSEENSDFINGNCSVSDTSLFACTFVTSRFSSTPSCVVAPFLSSNTDTTHIYPVAQSTSAISVRSGYSSGGSSTIVKAAYAFNLVCSRSTDYQSTNAYIASNGNYSRATYTPTFNGLGTPSSVECEHSRDGEFLEMACKFTAGTTTASEMRVGLPGSLTSSSTITSLRLAGYGNLDTSTTNQINVLIEPSVSYVTFGLMGSTSAGLAKKNGNDILNSGTKLSFFARIPIQGWTNSNLIVASLQGTPNIPGSTGKIDQIIFNYGTTNATTVCSASPCSYLDQIGTGAITSVTRSGTGSYVANFPRTYSKLKCTATTTNNSQGSVVPYTSSMSCSNCSTLSFLTNNTIGAFDTYGVLSCFGEY